MLNIISTILGCAIPVGAGIALVVVVPGLPPGPAACYAAGCQPATDGNYYPCAGSDGNCYPYCCSGGTNPNYCSTAECPSDGDAGFLGAIA